MIDYAKEFLGKTNPDEALRRSRRVNEVMAVFMSDPQCIVLMYALISVLIETAEAAHPGTDDLTSSRKMSELCAYLISTGIVISESAAQEKVIIN